MGPAFPEQGKGPGIMQMQDEKPQGAAQIRSGLGNLSQEAQGIQLRAPPEFQPQVWTAGRLRGVVEHSANLHQGARGYQLKELQEFPIVHADTAMGLGNAQGCRLRAAVDIDVAPQGIDGPATIATGFQPRQPEDTGQDPVPSGEARRQLGAVDLPRGPPADEDGPSGAAGPDPDADPMQTTGGAPTVTSLPRSQEGGGYRRREPWPGPFQEPEALARQVDQNPPSHPIPHPLPGR